MKSRETLIRLKRFQVDEKRRRVAQIETMIADFDRMATDLDREIAAEEHRSGISDLAHFAYPTYAKAARTRRDNLKRSADELKTQLQDAQANSAKPSRP
jgi:flagellar export protein FliJ